MERNDGYRLAVGLLLPATNVVAEEEFHRMAPEDVGIFTTRVLHKGRKPSDTLYEAVKRLADDVPDAVQRIKAVQPNVIVFACTAGSFLEGESWNQSITETMERICKSPSITTSTAVSMALEAMRLRSIAVGTPYPARVNEKLADYLTSLGVRVVRMAAVEYEKAQSEATAYTLVRQLDGPDIDGIFISCTDFWTVHVLDQLEQELGKPVISSNQASFWACLRLGGIAEDVKGFGSLLSCKWLMEKHTQKNV